MDRPLNLAHQEGRKADRCLAAGQFSEAIACHKKATEYLSQAINEAGSPAVVESLKLQYENHNKQQNIIKLKQKQLERRAQSLKNKLKTTPASREKTVKTDDIPDMEKKLTGAESNTELNNYLIYRTMTETDSLLQFVSNHHIGLMSETVTTKPSQESVSAAKSDQVVIEELRIHNEELCKLLKQCISKLESLEKENSMLKAKCAEYEAVGSQASSSDVFSRTENKMHLADGETLDLPPLDEPQFNFDAFKDFNDSSSSSQ